jgi:Protein of unknown function (DUF3043)
VRLLRRRTAGQAEDTAPDELVEAPTSDAVDARRTTAGKGRPTPRRREAQKRRTGPIAAPRTPAEARRMRSARRAETRAETSAGMRAGQEKYLMPRDRGPARKLVRDIVDSRRNAGSLFLLVAVVVFVGYLVPNPRIRTFTVSLWMAVFAVLIIDSVILGTRIRRTLRQREIESSERPRRLVWYGVTRATMIRRWRMPPPQIKVGEQP